MHRDRVLTHELAKPRVRRIDEVASSHHVTRFADGPRSDVDLAVDLSALDLEHRDVSTDRDLILAVVASIYAEEIGEAARRTFEACDALVRAVGTWVAIDRDENAGSRGRHRLVFPSSVDRSALTSTNAF